MTPAFRPFHLADTLEPVGALPLEVAEFLLGLGLVSAAEGGERLELAGGAGLDARLDDIRAALSDAGLIGRHRDEAMPLRLQPDGPELARVDRSAVRILGLWVDKVHINGIVPQTDDGPQVWLSRRAATADWNPDRFDTLVAGGRASGRSIAETVTFEAWEEAGIPADTLDMLRPSWRLPVTYVSEKGLHRERLVVFDLLLDADFRPVCHDAEIAWHRCMPLASLARLIAEVHEVKFSSRLVCQNLLGRLTAAAIHPAAMRAGD